MAFGRGGNGRKGGIFRHWKLILGIIVVLYVFSSLSSGSRRNAEPEQTESVRTVEAAPAEETKEEAAEAAQEETAKEPEVTVSQETETSEEEEQAEAAKEEESAPQTEEAAAEGIRPEFKETMDAYEKFFNDYCDFCVRYSQTDDPTAMMMDYLTWMTDYADTMEKLDEIDEESLTPAEDAYYLEVLLRIEKKNLEALQALGES